MNFRPLILLAFICPALAKGQASSTLGELDLGILVSYHTLLTDPVNQILGEEYELGGYLHDTQNGGVVAVTTSYIRNGVFETRYGGLSGVTQGLSQYQYQIGRLTSAKVRFGKLWELDYLEIFANVGFGYIYGANASETTGFLDYLFVDPADPVAVFTIPIGVDVQWYGFNNTINALGIKYEINGWNNYLGVGFTYLL